MQHIPIPQSAFSAGQQQLYRVPYLTDNIFEHETADFLDLPKLHGYDLSPHPSDTQMVGFRQGGNYYLRDRMFVQEWAFFRLIEKGHKLLSLPFERKLWIKQDGIRALHTESLASLTTERLTQLAFCWGRLKIELRRDVWLSLALELAMYHEKAHDLAWNMYNEAEKSISRTVGLQNSITPQFLSFFLSAILVCEFIERSILGQEVANHWRDFKATFRYSSLREKEYFRTRLLGAAWCPTEVDEALVRLSPSLLVTLTGFDRSYMQRKHGISSKSKVACACEIVDRHALKIIHDTNCARCDDFLDESDWETVDQSVVATVRSGNVPLLKIRTVQTSITIEVLDAHSNGRCVPYIALSHLWSDGLGPPATGRLPVCQMQRMRRLAAACSKHLTEKNLVSNSECLPVWLDSICVPLKDTALGDKARMMMTQIYGDAHAVVVLDSEVEKHSFSDDLAAVAMARIAFSRWISRGWTFQEGAFAKECFYSFKDQLVTIADIEIEHRRQLLTSIDAVWQANLNDAQIHEIIDNMNYGSSAFQLAKRAVEEFSTWTADRGKDTAFKLVRLWQSLRRRVISHQSDEALIIGGLLESPMRLDQTDGEKRMRSLFQSLREVPVSMLFHSGQRYDELKSRWIPHTMMRNYPGLATIDWRWKTVHRANVTQHGVEISLPGACFVTIQHPAAQARSLVLRIANRNYWMTHITENHVFRSDTLIKNNISELGLIFPPSDIIPLTANELPGTVLTVSVQTRSSSMVFCTFFEVLHVHSISPDVDLTNGSIIDGTFTRSEEKWCIG